MKKTTALLTLVAALHLPGFALHAEDTISSQPSSRHGAPSAPAVALPEKKAAVLPPLPEGVEQLKFADFFKTPVGPYGLEVTDKLKSLDGKRVRILGFMVFEEVTRCTAGEGARDRKGRVLPAWLECLTPGRLMLTPTPQQVSYAHYGVCDDLPPQTLYVTVPEKVGEPIPHLGGPLLLTGVLSVGNKPEPDGRISSVRLTLDPAPKTAVTLSAVQTTNTPNTTKTNAQ